MLLVTFHHFRTNKTQTRIIRLLLQNYQFIIQFINNIHNIMNNIIKLLYIDI
jgi:hypothetical protein